MNMKKNKGFTLAEVLIALTIIGVIAAVTVPVLMQNTNKQEYVTALQKAYSTLSQVTNQIIAEEGLPGGSGGWAGLGRDKVFELYFNKMNNAKICGTGKDCPLNNITYRKLSDKNSTYSYGTRQSLVLADGMSIGLGTVNKDCVYPDGTCVILDVDVNGAKSPNILGRDAFLFIVKASGNLVPTGCGQVCPSSSVYGWECTCRVLREGAMNY